MSGWRIAAASASGTSHIKQGTVCQDSHACRVFEDGAGRPVAVFVVSDGAGSAARADALEAYDALWVAVNHKRDGIVRYLMERYPTGRDGV